MRVVDEDGRDVAPGQVGEMVIKGENVMKGYWGEPGRTAEVLKGGYLHTGDLMTMDRDGYFYFVDRKKDAILSGGKEVSSREVEEVIYSHPSVREVAVIGIPDEELGQSIKAVVVTKEGKRVSGQEIIDFCCQYLELYKVPVSVDFVSSLPKASTGKILKAGLRERYLSL
jgi:long-chain acyl-CoA synthetase